MTSKEGGNAFHGYGLAQIEPWQSNNSRAICSRPA